MKMIQDIKQHEILTVNSLVARERWHGQLSGTDRGT